MPAKKKKPLPKHTNGAAHAKSPKPRAQSEEATAQEEATPSDRGAARRAGGAL
jgi:hypothetical protein